MEVASVSYLHWPPKAGNERSMLEVSKKLLVDIEMDLANDKVTTRYPAGIAGRQLSELLILMDTFFWT